MSGFFLIIIFSGESIWGKQNLETLKLTNYVFAYSIPVAQFSTFLFLVKYSQGPAYS